MDKKKLLFVCGQISPSSSQGVRYFNLLGELSKYYELTLISIKDLFPESIIGHKYYLNASIYSAKTRESKLKSNISIDRYVLTAYKQLVRPLIFPDKYRFYRKRIKALITRSFEDLGPHDLALIGMTPFSLYDLAKYLKKDYGLRVYCDLSDPFAYSGNQFNNVAQRALVEWYEKKKLRFVDGAIVLNPAVKAIYQKKLSYSNVLVVEQGVNLLPSMERGLKITNSQKQRLLYAGGLYKGFREAHNLYSSLANFEDYFFLDIYGNIESSLLPQTRNNCINYHGTISPKALKKEYLMTDVIVFIDNRKGHQVPGKLLEIQSQGRPILFIYENETSPSLKYIFNENIILVRNNKEEINDALKSLTKFDKKSRVSRELEKFTWPNLAYTYKTFIND